MNNRDYKLIKQKINIELKNLGKTAVYDNDFQKLLDLMFLYFTKNKDFEKNSFETDKGKIPYKIGKGLLVLGTTGRGKSFLFERVFYDYLKFIKSSRQYKRTTAEKIENIFLENGVKGYQVFLQVYKDAFLYIDELGIEEMELNDFGIKYKPMVKILNYRYKLFVKYNIKTFASTNLTLPELKEKYGQRIFSRFFEMFNIITVKGNDFRVELI